METSYDTCRNSLRHVSEDVAKRIGTGNNKQAEKQEKFIQIQEVGNDSLSDS